MSLFNAFCEDLVKQHNLEQCICRDYVVRLCPHEAVEDFPSHYVIETASGGTLTANCCIVSTGACQPNLPSWSGDCTCAVHSEQVSLPTFIHSPTPRYNNILIVGGGQTAAQLADVITDHPHLYSGCCHLAHRTKLRASHFDVSLDWIGRYNTKSMMTFRQSEPNERLRILRNATNGGSIQPDLCARIKTKVTDESLRLALLSCVEINFC